MCVGERERENERKKINEWQKCLFFFPFCQMKIERKERISVIRERIQFVNRTRGKKAKKFSLSARLFYLTSSTYSYCIFGSSSLIVIYLIFFFFFSSRRSFFCCFYLTFHTLFSIFPFHFLRFSLISFSSHRSTFFTYHFARPKHFFFF